MSLTPSQCARAMHLLIQPIVESQWFAPQTGEAFEAIGLEPRGEGYFAGRAAPMGRVGAGVVAATFFNFNPGIVAQHIPRVWDKAEPEVVLDARAKGVQDMWDALGADGNTIDDATTVAADALKGADLGGRPLAFANAAVPMPSTPFAALFQLLTVLREHRGDGHVALLTAFGLDPVEALVINVAWGGRPSRRFLQGSRIWDDDDWAAGEDRVRARGWMDADGELTEDGRAWRDGLEAETDRLAEGPYLALGLAGCGLFYDLLLPIARAINEEIGGGRAVLPASFDEAAVA